MEIFLGALTLVITIVIAVLQFMQVNRTIKLEKEVNQLNLKTSQSLQILFRARDAAIEWQKNQVFLMEYLRRTENLPDQRDWSIYAGKHADFSASWAELRGLAFAIGDENLKSIVTGGIPNLEKELFESEVRHKAQMIHTRIAELIAKETSIAEMLRG